MLNRFSVTITAVHFTVRKWWLNETSARKIHCQEFIVKITCVRWFAIHAGTASLQINLDDSLLTWRNFRLNSACCWGIWRNTFTGIRREGRRHCDFSENCLCSTSAVHHFMCLLSVFVPLCNRQEAVAVLQLHVIPGVHSAAFEGSLRYLSLPFEYLHGFWSKCSSVAGLRNFLLWET